MEIQNHGLAPVANIVSPLRGFRCRSAALRKRRGTSMKTFLAFIVAVMFALSGPAAAQAQENSGVQRPVTQQEIDRLKRQIDQDTRSSVEAIMDYHTESGDLNNRLDFFRYGGRLNLKLGSSAFQFRGTRTDYLPIGDVLRQQGTNITAGFRTKLSETTEAHVEAGATRFSTDTG